MNIAGATAMVTGGGRGVGRSIAQRLSDEGVRLVLVGRDRDSLVEAARSLPKDTNLIQADLGTPQGRSVAAEAVIDNHVNVLVNNAGVQMNGPWLEMPASELVERIETEIQTNLVAPLALTALTLSHLADQPDAAVVNISSGLGVAPKASAPAYCATKAGLRSATRSLRYQMADAATAVRFIDVVLPLVDTDMTRGREGNRKASPQEVADAVVKAVIDDVNEVWVGRARLLPPLMRLAPSVAYKMLRGTVGE